MNDSFDPETKINLTELINWSELEVGDIICLHKDEMCPADLLILDMKEKYCTVDSSMITGFSNEENKFSVKLTSGINK